MGLRLPGISRSSLENISEVEIPFPSVRVPIKDLNKIIAGNPHPSRWSLNKCEEVNKCTVVELIYKDCTNYEGKKILVFYDNPFHDILRINKGKIDPHFSDSKEFIHPIARFEPTKRGWWQAIQFAALVVD